MDTKSVDRQALKLRRIISGKTQTSLAQEVGRSQPWLCRVECGERGSVVTGRDLINLGAALSVPASYLEER